MPRRIYHLKITLVGTGPPVWRRLLVPGGFTLDRLSRAIQLAFGWHGHHLHSFEVGGRQYGEPDPLNEGELDLDDELDTRLDKVAQLGDRFTYVYDFGDWWEHEIVVEEIGPAELDQRYPTCDDGERAGPPEDVGGPEGYGRVLEVLADPNRPDPLGVRDWLEGFDPTRFDPPVVSTLLRRMT